MFFFFLHINMFRNYILRVHGNQNLKTSVLDYNFPVVVTVFCLCGADFLFYPKSCNKKVFKVMVCSSFECCKLLQISHKHMHIFNVDEQT